MRSRLLSAFLLCLTIASLSLAFSLRTNAAKSQIDLTQAVVVSSSDASGPEKKALAMLVDEVEKRTHIRWRISTQWPSEPVPVITVGRASSVNLFAGRFAQELSRSLDTVAPEGYRLQLMNQGSAPAVVVVGNDPRGVLFGVGHLLRSLEMSQGKVLLPGSLKIDTAPKYPLRGHQLGYRPKTNSYDGWTLVMWEQYIRDLAVFGTNAIELIPPRSDDDADSPHFPLNPMDTMIGMSRLCDEYGLDVWIWYPALDKDYSDPKTVEFSLNEWGEVFKRLPRIDAVFVPGGDPGHTQPKYLMALLEKQTQVLHRYHPKAQMWVAPQGFGAEWMNEFLGILRQEPAWLTGVVYGPQVRMSLPALRSQVPRKYPIRHYPDITHSRHCQYPVPDWDTALAFTEGREVINPRPLGHASIFRQLQPYTIGFIAYSEGCNDDVNKIMWSALGWDPKADITGILRDYSRYFIGPSYRDNFSQGLLALERNWRGAVLTNSQIDGTLQQFQALEKSATPQDRLNWRFQQGLYRAYYDAYVRRRLINETALEENAMTQLREAPRIGAQTAILQAEKSLDRVVTEPGSQELRARLFELAEDLYQSIRMQLSVPLYRAIAIGRGANLDTVDFPLNNRFWLKQRFAKIRRFVTESERLKALDDILHWTDPGSGGFYDDLGDPTSQPHLLRGIGFEKDPAFFESSLVSFERYEQGPNTPRKSWWNHAVALYDAPVQMRYSDLDPASQYKIKVVYGGGPIRLRADDQFEIHPYLEKVHQVLEFDVPQKFTADGVLHLTWNGEPGVGGAGRGCQVAEVWLSKRK